MAVLFGSWTVLAATTLAAWGLMMDWHRGMPHHGIGPAGGIPGFIPPERENRERGQNDEGDKSDQTAAPAKTQGDGDSR